MHCQSHRGLSQRTPCGSESNYLGPCVILGFVCSGLGGGVYNAANSVGGCHENDLDDAIGRGCFRGFAGGFGGHRSTSTESAERPANNTAADSRPNTAAETAAAPATASCPESAERRFLEPAGWSTRTGASRSIDRPERQESQRGRRGCGRKRSRRPRIKFLFARARNCPGQAAGARSRPLREVHHRPCDYRIRESRGAEPGAQL